MPKKQNVEKRKKPKIIFYEKYIKIQCPLCGRMTALDDCGLPTAVMCDACLETFKPKQYRMKERRKR